MDWNVAVKLVWSGIGIILPGVITGVLTGVIVAIVGVGVALKQFKMQRGFERRLDWYEKTTQALFEFLHLNDGIAFAIENNRWEILDEAVKNPTALAEFQKTMNNSLLYANPEIYLRLKEVGAKLRETTKLTGESHGRGQQSAAPYRSNVKLLEQTLFELSQPIREMLGLDPLTRADFDK